MIETLVIASHGLPDAGQARRLRHDLPPEEWQWIARLHQPADRLRSLAGRALARRLLATRLGLAPAEVRLVAGPHGKPALAHSPPQWHFNIAHSGSQVLVALGPHPLGVDVETCPDTVDEALLLRVTGEPAGTAGALVAPRAFCVEWVCREAVLKTCGLGLALEPGRLRLATAVGGWRRVGGAPQAEGLHVRVLWQSPLHCAALCLPAAAAPPAWRLLRLNLDDWLESPGIRA
ncbi:hypothetical protein [Castellaniella sp. GW247-6E4]|uniref:4'-phosphopantetheinyl transferase family protein n=1 Tax=Castellaniella sp. GW247-6E4 TaxID=3140380 RepID=UPI003315E05C